MKRGFKVFALAFIAFELWRFAVVGASLVPLWRSRLLPDIISIGNYPPAVMAVVIIVALVAFIIPMALVVYVLRLAHRQLSRFRTAR